MKEVQKAIQKIKYLGGRTVWWVRKNGLKRTLTVVYNWITKPELRRENRLNPRKQYDNIDLLLKQIDFEKNYLHGDHKLRVSKNNLYVSWVVPPFDIGSGGHQTMFRIARRLGKKGYVNRVYITDGHTFKDEQEAYNLIQKHFFQIPNLEVYFLKQQELVDGTFKPKPTDFVVATRYNTAYYACMFKECYKRFYLIQDYEPMFFATGYESVFAENSYKLGLHPICASPWLAEVIGEYGEKPDFFYLGYEREVYSDKEAERESKSVAFYARFESERRVVELGMLALEILQKRMPELKVYLYGSNDTLGGYDLQVENLGVVDYPAMAELFNKVSVGLSFSLTNYGLTPTEMMACSLPVVELKGENTEAVFEDGENILLAERNPQDVADKIEKLLVEEELRTKIHDGMKRFIKGKDWESALAPVEAVFDNASEGLNA